MLFDSSSVEKIDMGTRQAEPVATIPQGHQPISKEISRSGQRLAIGQRFGSLEELVKDQLAAGYVRTGYFGKHWPATVTEVATDKHKISFVRQNGTRHNYVKFAGYDMKMVRLMAGANETIVVFRSQHKN